MIEYKPIYLNTSKPYFEVYYTETDKEVYVGMVFSYDSSEKNWAATFNMTYGKDRGKEHYPYPSREQAAKALIKKRRG